MSTIIAALGYLLLALGILAVGYFLFIGIGENEYNAVVYLVVRTPFGIAVLDSLLYVSRYDEEWEDEIESLKDGYVLTYTVNYLNPDCSEFGDIAFSTTLDGEIVREG